MKTIRVFLATVLFFSGKALQAQDNGETGLQTEQTAKNENWQNWAFAGSMLLTAACAIFFISIHNGNPDPSNHHLNEHAPKFNK